MKLLVVCQYYYPEPFRIHDICEELVKRGHEVMVVTGEPNYPEGVIYAGYEHHQKSDEIIRGVQVHRCPIVPRKTGAFYRLLNYFSYPVSARHFIGTCLALDGTPFDVVLVNQLSPVMMAEPAIAYRKKYGVPVVMYCLDLWPESLVAGGIRRKSLVYRVFHKISSRIYRAMDYILLTSQMFRTYLRDEFQIENDRMEYLPQYAEEIFGQLPHRKEDGTFHFTFAGNIGASQSVVTILEAADKLRDCPAFFHIVGDGSDLERLKKIAQKRNLSNVVFYGRLPLQKMPDIYSQADAMLVTLTADPFLSLTLPGKVQSYMAAGKPIIGAINGETAKIIREARCGFCGEAENPMELADNIRRFIGDEHKERMGRSARAFYEQRFAKQAFMDKLEHALSEAMLNNGFARP